MSEQKPRISTVEVIEGKPVTDAELQVWVDRHVALVVDEYRDQHGKEGNT